MNRQAVNYMKKAKEAFRQRQCINSKKNLHFSFTTTIVLIIIKYIDNLTKIFNVIFNTDFQLKTLAHQNL